MAGQMANWFQDAAPFPRPATPASRSEPGPSPKLAEKHRDVEGPVNYPASLTEVDGIGREAVEESLSRKAGVAPAGGVGQPKRNVRFRRVDSRRLHGQAGGQAPRIPGFQSALQRRRVSARKIHPGVWRFGTQTGSDAGGRLRLVDGAGLRGTGRFAPGGGLRSARAGANATAPGSALASRGRRGGASQGAGTVAGRLPRGGVAGGGAVSRRPAVFRADQRGCAGAVGNRRGGADSGTSAHHDRSAQAKIQESRESQSKSCRYA